jgi:hypothetical protein
MFLAERKSENVQQTEQTLTQVDGFVASSIEYLMWLKSVGLIVCGSRLILLINK